MPPELDITSQQFPLPGYGMEVDAWSFGVVYFLLKHGTYPFDTNAHGYPDVATLWMPAHDAGPALSRQSVARIWAGLLQPLATERIRLSDVPSYNWLVRFT